MKTSEAVKSIMKEAGIGVNKMAYMMGRSPRLVSERISQENISIAKLNEILRMLDYKIVLMPRGTRTPDKGHEVE